jgi:serine/threonine protein kinase
VCAFLQLRLLFRLREVAEGMQFLHDTARVVHGDLKSNNILLCVAPTAPYGRTAKVADFGLARVYQAGETHKSTKTLGTVSSNFQLSYCKLSACAGLASYKLSGTANGILDQPNLMHSCDVQVPKQGLAGVHQCVTTGLHSVLMGSHLFDLT